MDQVPFKLEIHLLIDDYVDLIELLKSKKQFKYYGNYAQKELDKQIANF
jgi:hypothetical protein